MATLYFHIPFCKRICTYCDFYKVGAIELIPRVVEVMHRELDERASYLQERSLTSIYFGGGTPSLLHPEQIEGLISHARRLFDCSKVEEITLEANPDDLSTEYIAELRKTSINRISLGIQSFNDDVLRFMNRRHSASEARECVERLRRTGYNNISIDIIFGVAGFGEEWLRDTIEEAIKLNAEHISAYHLTVEERTRLGVLVRKGEYQPVSEEQSENDYLLVESMLCEAGYEHYEVSNYARPEHRAKHNSAYWRGVEYLGIGAGAHSFSGDDRRWCISTAKEYSEGNIRFESEELTQTDHLNEYIMTSLRTKEGIDLSYIEAKYGKKECERILLQATSWQQRGVLTLAEDRLYIPTSEFMLSDAVIETLFL
ncbi:MAG: radical SAM family heme chaperone HemW [Alistipes sp.]|nr:radical SAM family heme chaperone HemW [Alistipes sp.]